MMRVQKKNLKKKIIVNRQKEAGEIISTKKKK